MKTLNTFLILFLILTSFSSADEPITTTNRSLLLMEPKEFFSHEAAHQQINLQNPNHHLLSVSVFQATNLLRKLHGLQALKPDYSLHLAGMDHISSMRKHQFFDHYNPYNSKQRTFRQRIENHGGKFRAVGENIALVHPFQTDKNYYRYRKIGNQYHYYNEHGQPLGLMTYGQLGKSILRDWYNSLGHRRSILSVTYTHLGVATLICTNNNMGKALPKVYAVQNFGAY